MSGSTTNLPAAGRFNGKSKKVNGKSYELRATSFELIMERYLRASDFIHSKPGISFVRHLYAVEDLAGEQDLLKLKPDSDQKLFPLKYCQKKLF